MAHNRPFLDFGLTRPARAILAQMKKIFPKFFFVPKNSLGSYDHLYTHITIYRTSLNGPKMCYKIIVLAQIPHFFTNLMTFWPNFGRWFPGDSANFALNHPKNIADLRPCLPTISEISLCRHGDEAQHDWCQPSALLRTMS